MAEIVLEHVVKRYPDGALAVDDFNLDIADGEFIILVGPSGCGKSTTLNMVAGLEDITAGKLIIDGQVVNDKAPKDRDIAMVFQSYALYPHMTVRQNIAFPLTLAKMKKAEIAQKVEETAKTLDLTVDDARVDLLQHVIAEAEPLNRAGREVLGEYVGLFDQLLDELHALFSLQIDRRGFLVRVQDLEIERIRLVRIGGRDAPPGIAALRVFDFDDLGAEPGQGFGAGRSRLELGQIDDPNAFQAVKRRVISTHSLRLLHGGNSPEFLIRG